MSELNHVKTIFESVADESLYEDAKREEYELAKRRQEIIKLISDAKNILERELFRGIYDGKKWIHVIDNSETTRAIKKLDKAVTLI